MHDATPLPADRFIAHGDLTEISLEATERIGRPLPGRLPRLLRRVCLLGVLGASAWMWAAHRETVETWTARATDIVERVMAEQAPPRRLPGVDRPPPLDEIAARNPPSATDDARTAGSSGGRVPPDEAQSEPVADAAPLDPLPPPVVAPGDVLQAKALASGLHPGLSRVLLEAMSETDYRNAAKAIRTALATTPDGEVLTYPAERRVPLAQFQVGFVTGTRADCRRYIVRIARVGWLTTAQAMETCGIAKPVSRVTVRHNMKDKP